MLDISPQTAPYVLHHCVVPQRPGWPEPSDRRPVVPAATVVRHLTDAAEHAASGAVAVGVRQLRLDQWVDAWPQARVSVVVTADGPEHMAVSFGPYARALVHLAAAYPLPPEPWPARGRDREAPALSAAELYERRWLPQGPAYRGLTRLLPHGAAEFAAAVTVPPAPGALLDTVGQLLRYAVLSDGPDRASVPVRVRGVRFFGPTPPVGASLVCRLRVVSRSATSVVADAQLLREGRVWAQVCGWQERLLAGPDVRLPGGYPESRTLSARQDGGWVFVCDDWPDLVSRDVVMRTQLGRAERAEYARRSPHGRRQWLLSRIAAKDAVRLRLWERGAGPVYPAEIRVRDDLDGRVRAQGVHGRAVPALHVAVAHRADAAVALARAVADGPPPGIAVEPIAPRVTEYAAETFSPGEQFLLLRRFGGARAAGVASFRAAKRAVASAEGVRPREVTVVAADGAELVLAVRDCRRTARGAEVTGRTPGRRYAVAWTVEPPGPPASDPSP